MSRPSFIRTFGRWLRRAVLKNKSLYFISSSPKPLSEIYGFERGTPLDRHYIESFLDAHKARIRGACLELQEDMYTKRYGQGKVTKSDVLDIDSANKQATIIADLRGMPAIASDSYDCIILTQVLQFIDTPAKALDECWRVLKPGGTLIATLPSLSRIDCQAGVNGDYWRFTKAGAEVLFKANRWKSVSIESRGNCRSGLYFLAGVAKEEAGTAMLDADDENFPVIITAFAQK